MKKTKHDGTQIAALLREHAAGKDVSVICRDNNIDRATFRQWHRDYRGLSAAEINRKRENAWSDNLLPLMLGLMTGG